MGSTRDTPAPPPRWATRVPVMERLGKPATGLAAKCCPSRRGRFAGKRKNDCEYELTSALSLETKSWWQDEVIPTVSLLPAGVGRSGPRAL